MNTAMLMSNLTNPTLLFFVLGIFAVALKSDLEIPPPVAKFISLYLLFSIGFKGGLELAHGEINGEVIGSLFYGLLIAGVIPVVTFFILKKRLGATNAGAVAATYGSVSAVTFVAATGFLEAHGLKFGGHMVAVMALMEAPAIIVGVLLMRSYEEKKANGEATESFGSILMHSFTSGSVLLIIGALVIGFIADPKQADGLKPFTTDIFKGFLAMFLLEMGMTTAKRIKSCFSYGSVVYLFALIAPLVNGCVVAYTSQFVTADVGNRFIFAILAASASYIAVPAAMRLAAPDADPGLYVPMALGLTFPLNITIGMPIYFALVSMT